MNLLNVQPVPPNPDDGVKAIYECQACLRVDTAIMDPYATPDHIRCWDCGWYEGDEHG